jgi:hypothetical protein
MRVESWRKGWLHIDGPQDVLFGGFKFTSSPAQVWPAAEACQARQTWQVEGPKLAP